MKKCMIIAVVAAMVAGCSSENEYEPGNDSPVEIKLKANVYEVSTKAPVTPTTGNITAGFVASNTTGVYKPNAWFSAATFDVSITGSQTFSFATKQYYPTDATKNIHITGYYPADANTSLTDSVVTFSNTDGTQDLMWASEVSGNKTTATPLSFTFHHSLTQLQFQLVAGTNFPATGVSVTKIIIRNQKTPHTLNVTNGGVTYNAAADLTFTGNYPITVSPGTLATVYPMVKPGEVTTINITTSDGAVYQDIPLTGLTTLPENSHLITLTFTPKEITATAIITAWKTGTGTSSNVTN